MALISIFIVLILVGVLLFLVNTVVPMVPWMRTVINVLAALAVFLWLLQVFGISTGVNLHLR